MKEMNEKILVNLPSDIKLLLNTGKYSLYTLSKKFSEKGAYLLAVSRSDTFFVQQDGTIGEAAGKLGSIEVEDLVRFHGTDSSASLRVNIA